LLQAQGGQKGNSRGDKWPSASLLRWFLKNDPGIRLGLKAFS